MEQRKKTNDGKMDGWHMDQAVNDVKKGYEEDKKDTKEIPVITTKKKK